MTFSIPNEFKVGFNSRKDTFAGQLSFLIYKNKPDGTYGQEHSFQSWIDKSIPTQILDNDFKSGFIFNKARINHGRYGKSVKYRMFHPNGFEFEISAYNLALIVAHSHLDQGEILDQCIIAWDRADVFLLTKKMIDQKLVEVNYLNISERQNKINKKLINKIIPKDKVKKNMIFLNDDTLSFTKQYKPRLNLLSVDNGFYKYSYRHRPSIETVLISVSKSNNNSPKVSDLQEFQGIISPDDLLTSDFKDIYDSMKNDFNPIFNFPKDFQPVPYSQNNRDELISSLVKISPQPNNHKQPDLLISPIYVIIDGKPFFICVNLTIRDYYHFGRNQFLKLDSTSNYPAQFEEVPQLEKKYSNTLSHLEHNIDYYKTFRISLIHFGSAQNGTTTSVLETLQINFKIQEPVKRYQHLPLKQDCIEYIFDNIISQINSQQTEELKLFQ